MKIKTKKNYLLGILLSAFLIIGIINITNGEPNVIDTNPDSSKLHTASLRSLFLGDSDVDTGFSWMRVNTGGSSLDILNGLIVGSDNSVSQGSKMVVIGGGRGNSVNANNAGIAGGSGNAVDWEDGAIGGGLGNMGSGIIAGGNSNKISNVLGVILGGFKNISKGGIVLGGSGNMVGENSIAFGQNAKGDKNSFAWNAHASENYVRIDASGGMLIGTYSPVSGVYLVVSGSVKLGSGNFHPTTGGIWVDGSGCIKASDGGVSYTLGRSSESDSKCGTASGCQFGKTILHNGDKVTGYPVSYALKCEEEAETVTCIDGKFYDSGNHVKDIVYPYCYDLSLDPTLTLTGGIKQCSGALPDNAVWKNVDFEDGKFGYFEQKKGNDGKWYPVSLDTVLYTEAPQGQKCTYDCVNSRYNPETKKCEGGCYGNLPGSHIRTGSASSFAEWTYTDNQNPGACQWTCEVGYHPNDSQTECVQNECQGTLPTGATVNNSSARPNTIKEYFCNAQSTEACAYSCGDHAVCNSAGTGCRPLDNGECYEDEPYGCMNSSNTVSKVDTTGDNQWKWYCVGQDGTGSLCTKSCEQGELKWTSLHSGTCVSENLRHWECKKDLNIGGTCERITKNAWCDRHVPSDWCFYDDPHGQTYVRGGICSTCYQVKGNCNCKVGKNQATPACCRSTIEDEYGYVNCNSFVEGGNSCNRVHYCNREYEIDSDYDYVCVDSEGNILSDSDCDGLPAIDCSENFIDDNGGEVSPDEAPRCGGYMKCGSGDPVVTNGGNWKCVNDDGDEVCCGCSTRCPCGYEYDNISKKCKINKKYCVYEQWDAVGPCFDTPGNNERTMPAGFAVKITGLGKKLEPREGYLAGLVWIDTAYGNVPGAQELSSCVSLPIDFDRCAGELKHADVLGEYNQGYYLTSCRVDGQSYSEMEPSDEYCVVDDGNMYCPVSG